MRTAWASGEVSAGHHSQVAFGIDAAHLDKLLDNDQVRERLFRSRKVIRDFDMPYIGGYSVNGENLYLDRHLPERITLEQDGSKKEVDPTIPLTGYRGHEPFEWSVMDALGWGYDAAHRAATGSERRVFVSHYGPDWWDPWQRAMQHWAKADEHERLVKMPKDYDTRPILAPPVNRALVAAVRRAMGGEGEARKLTKAAVDYTVSGAPREHCGNCEHYIPANACELVRGYIAHDGWCNKWAKE